jgi:putative ABC transport system ATP-binding protein
MGTDVPGFIMDAVTVVRGHTRVLDEVSECIEAGQATAIIGPSGAGKTTLLRTLNRLEEPTSGQVRLDGVPLPELDVLHLRRQVGLVAQRPVLLTEHVTEELRVGAPSLREDQVGELLERVGLAASFARRPTVELSGGEAQRVCLARSLAVQPEVLLLDEPTSALDGLNASLVAALARDHAAGGGTVVLVSHDLTVVRHVADRVLVLDGGHLVATGPPEEIDYRAAG